MGDFDYSVSSMSSISADSYVLNTSSSSGFYSTVSATEGGKSTITMQDDCLLDQSGGVKGPGGSTSGVEPSSDDHQPQTLSTSQEEENKSGVNGENIIGGSVNVGPVSITTVGPPGAITTLGSSVLGPPGSGTVPTAAIVAAAGGGGGGGAPMGSGMVQQSGGGHHGPGVTVGMEAASVAIPSTISSSVSSLWSPVDDPLLHSGISAINGSLAFTNLGPGASGNPGGPSPLFNNNLGPQIGIGTGLPHRRNMQPGGPNFPVPTRPQNLGPSAPQGPFVTNKYSAAWSTGVTGLVSQGNTWSPACPSPQGTGGGGGPGGPVASPASSIGGVGSWSRGRGVSGVGGVSPLGMAGVPSVRNPAKLPNASSMLMNKYRRSTSYPGKGPFPQPPTFEITGVDDGGFARDLLPYPQVRYKIVTFERFNKIDGFNL